MVQGQHPLATMSDFLPTIDSDDELPAPQTGASSKQGQKEAQNNSSSNNKKRKREELQQNKSKRKDDAAAAAAASDDFAGGFTFDNLGGAYTSNSGKGDVWVRCLAFRFF